ncbi:MAG: purine biosynthesis protein PurH [Ruminococcus sp.]|nr:purine biosynthesis protein PurH [Ruminococcus sp.]MDD6645368.1 purine biosynthesis protein PurH [Oscillospiraceae bacterium]
MYKSIKIAHTTREERIEIVKNSLSFGEESCEGSVGFDVMSMYQPYIDGEKEISQINMEFHSGMVK